jgi:hypothetical protein
MGAKVEYEADVEEEVDMMDRGEEGASISKHTCFNCALIHLAPTSHEAATAQ